MSFESSLLQFGLQLRIGLLLPVQKRFLFFLVFWSYLASLNKYSEYKVLINIKFNQYIQNVNRKIYSILRITLIDQNTSYPYNPLPDFVIYLIELLQWSMSYFLRRYRKWKELINQAEPVGSENLDFVPEWKLRVVDWYLNVAGLRVEQNLAFLMKRRSSDWRVG